MTPLPPPARTSARRELLFSTAALFGGSILVAASVVAVTFPLIDSPGSALLLLSLILGANLAILFLFLRGLLARTVFDPLERMGAAAERIAEGDLEHRIPEEPGEELDRLARSLNRMAEHLIANQERLAENVASLDRANRELRAATDELVRSARLASVGTMAAGIAHEVGNPLGAAMGYLDVALRRQEEGSPLTEPLEAASGELRRIDRIIRSVLAFARPERGAGEEEAVEVGALVERVLELLRSRGALKGVVVELHTDPHLSPVTIRPQHLEQVFMNLLLNALAAIEGRELRRIRITLEPGAGGEGVEVGVEDSGPGIPPELLPRIFDPFFTTREPGEGTGLGLALAVRILQEVGGSIHAGNAEGGGARFRLSLPGGDAAPGTHPPEGSAS